MEYLYLLICAKLTQNSIIASYEVGKKSAPTVSPTLIWAVKGDSNTSLVWDVTVGIAWISGGLTDTTKCPGPLAQSCLNGAGVCPHFLHKRLSNMAHSNKAAQLQDNGSQTKLQRLGQTSTLRPRVNNNLQNVDFHSPQTRTYSWRRMTCT